MIRWIFRVVAFALPLILASCEKPLIPEAAGNCRLDFSIASGTPSTRGNVNIGDYFSKLNVMLFDDEGNKVLDKVYAQTSDDDGFGSPSFALSEGSYWVVAVGHSSKRAATIKSTQAVQFTAQDGEKLTDTFSYCGEIDVSETPERHDLTMNRASAMFRVVLTDSVIPSNCTHIKFDYKGGSANFNPSTLQGITKSTQSELRAAGGDTYCVYTFPYMATEGLLQITVSALDEAGVVLVKREFKDVPVTRNRITTYRGEVFGEGGGEITQTEFGFTINGDWDGEDIYEF